MSKSKIVRFVATALMTLLALEGSCPAQQKGPSLTAEDEKLFAGLVRDFLFDPRGAERVEVAVPLRSLHGTFETKTEAWLVQKKDDRRIFLTDGASFPAPPPEAIRKIDFVAKCRRDYDQPPSPKVRERNGEESAVVIAAWLYRLGEKELAAKALHFASVNRQADIAFVRTELTWTAYSQMVHAYMVRADDDALSHGERLLRCYAPEAKEYPQAAAVVQDLKRRKERGTFGKPPADALPVDFAKWNHQKQATYLINALDEVDARQHSQPGDVSLAHDFRFLALVDLGEPAVAALLDVLEKDNRLTRSVHFHRNFTRHREVLSVRDVVLPVLMSILHTVHFEESREEFSRQSKDEATWKRTAKAVRAYWKEFGGIPFDERMMKILTDRRSRFEVMREAAENLTIRTEKRYYSRGSTTYQYIAEPKEPNPVIKKFKNPTVAEAILAAMLRDLDQHNPLKLVPAYIDRGRIEDTYFFALIALGDQRIRPELARRADAAGPSVLGRKWSFAAYRLGEPEPMRRFANAFAAGKMQIATIQELEPIVSYLAKVDLPEAERALHSLINPKHPAHSLAAEGIREASGWATNNSGFLAHPYCLAFIRHALDDVTLTQTSARLSNNGVEWRFPNGAGSSSLPELISDRKNRKNSADERVCDRVAATLSSVTFGFPDFHLLVVDADDRIALMKKRLDQYQSQFKRITDTDGAFLSKMGYIKFVLHLPLRDRAATAADVKAGKAIFHLNGKGKTVDMKLPAFANWKKDAHRKDPPVVVIVQAEKGPDDVVLFGIVDRHAFHTVASTELSIVNSLPLSKKEL